MDSILLRLWKKSLDEISPSRILPTVSNEAVLYWGKAALACFEARPPKSGYPYYIVQGEHPIPGPASFKSGREILDFFDSLRRMNIKRLRVFLSGGASSMAWLKPARISENDLENILVELYKKPLTIQKLNETRSKYCELKSGGAARWLKKTAPHVHVRVDVISDVEPYGPEVIGSGPFWDGKIKHSIACSNSVWVRTISQLVKKEKMAVLDLKSGQTGEVRQLAMKISHSIEKNKNKSGILIFGLEPQVKMGKNLGRGGRQSHLAALLLLRHWDLIANRKIEILCATSDGTDGLSGGSGVFIQEKTLKKIQKETLKTALKDFNTGLLFGMLDALVPRFQTETNVQDVVLVKFN
jgi:hydroxypyruvate reductase